MVDVPPLLISGSGCPVTGTRPTATAMLNMAWMTSSRAKPIMRSAGNVLTQRLAMVAVRKSSMMYSRHTNCAGYAHLFDDDGVDEVRECLRQEVALYGVAWAFAYYV